MTRTDTDTAAAVRTHAIEASAKARALWMRHDAHPFGDDASNAAGDLAFAAGEAAGSLWVTVGILSGAPVPAAERCLHCGQPGPVDHCTAPDAPTDLEAARLSVLAKRGTSSLDEPAPEPAPTWSDAPAVARNLVVYYLGQFAKLTDHAHNWREYVRINGEGPHECEACDTHMGPARCFDGHHSVHCGCDNLDAEVVLGMLQDLRESIALYESAADEGADLDNACHRYAIAHGIDGDPLGRLREAAMNGWLLPSGTRDQNRATVAITAAEAEREGAAGPQRTLIVCCGCDGTNVQAQVWANPNDGYSVIDEDRREWATTDTVYCRDCDDHMSFDERTVGGGK